MRQIFGGVILANLYLFRSKRGTFILHVIVSDKYVDDVQYTIDRF